MSVSSSPVPDEQLWQRAVGGDGDAFAELFERHVDAVYTHCRRRDFSVADAEDITSMVFLEAWRKAAKLRIVNGSARPWLLVVATNMMRTQWRSRRRYDRLLARLPHGEDEPDVADAVVEDAASAARAAALGAAIAGLRREEQDVVTLCDLGEVSYADAAEALGIPIGTVRSRLFRARRALRAALGEPSVDPSPLRAVPAVTR